VQQWAVVARQSHLQLCRSLCRQSHPLRFPHHHLRRRLRNRQPDPRLPDPCRPQHHRGLLIHTIVQWECTRLGMEPSRRGAAAIITSAVSQLNHHAQQIPTTARMDSRTGRRAGLWPRRNGVAEFMARAARIKVAAVLRSRPLRPLRSRTIARQGSRIGWQVGLWPRRPGVVRTRARAAHRRLEGAPELRLVKWLMHDFGAGLGAIFRRYWHA